MGEESTNQGSSSGWSEGGPDVSEMEGDAVSAEIRAIEQDPSFAGEGLMPWQKRQGMFKRRDQLYNHESRRDPGKEAALELGLEGMYDTLKKANITPESIRAEQQAFKDRDLDEQMAKSRHELEFKFGSKDEADRHLKVAKDVLKRFGTQDDLYFIDETGLGNDPDFIELLSRLGKKLENARRGGK